MKPTTREYHPVPAHIREKRKTWPRYKRHWTQGEDDDLELRWSEMDKPQLERHFQRPFFGIMRRAVSVLKLPGVPQGMESLKQASIRLGFHKDSLPRILAWAGVKTQSARTSRLGANAEHRIVSSGLAEEAVEAFLATATPAEWGRERGITRGRVNAMVRHGIRLNIIRHSMRFGNEYRLTEEDFDRVQGSWESRVADHEVRRNEALVASVRRRFGVR